MKRSLVDHSFRSRRGETIGQKRMHAGLRDTGEKQTCEGCRATMPKSDYSPFCYRCDLGILKSDLSGPRLAMALRMREKLGPAGGIGKREKALDVALRGR